MKKLFFSALVAVAAIGGAQAVTFYPEGGGIETAITCEDEPIANCTTGLSDEISYYTQPQSQGDLVNPFSLYSDYHRTN